MFWSFCDDVINWDCDILHDFLQLCLIEIFTRAFFAVKNFFAGGVWRIKSHCFHTLYFLEHGKNRSGGWESTTESSTESYTVTMLNGKMGDIDVDKLSKQSANTGNQTLQLS